MPVLFNKRLGEEVFVPTELVGTAAASGDYDLPEDLKVSLRTPAGRLVEGSQEDVATADDAAAFSPATEADTIGRARRARVQEEHGGLGGAAATVAENVVEGVTLGGFSAAKRGLFGEEGVRGMREREELRPGLATASQIAGSVAPALVSGGGGALGAAARLTPAGAAARLGTSIARSGGGGFGRAAVGVGTEGAIAGFGQGVHKLALEEDPLTLEHAMGTLSSNALLGAGIGAGAGILGKVAEKGLLRAKRAVDEGAARMQVRAGVGDDLAGMDARGLREAETAEAEAIEAARVPERAALADEIMAFRQQSKGEKWWLATKGDKDFAELGKVAMRADRRLDVLTDNIKALRQNPRRAMDALQQQEQRLQEVLDRAPEIRAKVEADHAAKAAAPAAPVRAKLPTYDELPAAEADEWYVTKTIPIEDLKPLLMANEGFDPGRVQSIRRGLDEGAAIPPADVSVTPSGKFVITDGRHRLRVAAERGGDVEVRLSRAAEDAEQNLSPLFPDAQPAPGATAIDDAAMDAAAAAKEPIVTPIVRGEMTVKGSPVRLEARVHDLSAADDAAKFDPQAEFWPWQERRTSVRAIRQLADGTEETVGTAMFAHKGDTLYPKGVFVDESVQRGGLGTRMYEMAQGLTPGRKIVAADLAEQSAEGTAFSAAFRGRGSGGAAPVASSRLQALDSVPTLLERNRALQARIEELIKPATSPRLAAIADARAVLGSAKPGRGMLEEGATAYAATALLGLSPGGPIGAVAAVMAPKAIRKIGDWVFGRMGRSGAAAAQRSAKAVSALLEGGAKTAKVAPPMATRILSKVAFGPAPARSAAAPVPRGTPPLHAAYQARARELEEQVMAGPDGVSVMRPEARERIFDSLSGVRALSPILADRMESLAVRRIEYLAAHLPKRPDMGHMQMGPSHWQPTDREMRTFARRVSAVEDPGGVEERAAAGIVTPEEADAYRAVYPERAADFTRRIVEQVSMLKEPLTWSRRLGLTVLTGVPMDPSLTPPVLRVMQGVYASEPGTAGGMQAPKAQPQFGSLGSAKNEMTPSQERQQ
jgi:hypothetical protein